MNCFLEIQKKKEEFRIWKRKGKIFDLAFKNRKDNELF